MAKNTNPTGINRTGVGSSPIDSKAMIESANRSTPAPGDESEIAGMRRDYTKEATAEPVGALPPPVTVKGVATAAFSALKGKNPQVFIDILGERLAFERTGSRLYEAFLAKLDGAPSSPTLPQRDLVQRFHDEEVGHFQLLKQAIEKLGGDPTVETPSADMAGVEGAGLLQVLTDPRTTTEQCLHTLLVAELADYEGWEVLIQLSTALGQDDLSSSFRQALQEESIHLTQVRRWFTQTLATQAGAQLQMTP